MPLAPTLTIDGPGGSGKGTVGRRVAHELGWHFLDSGALYRLLALAAINHGIELEDVARLAPLATQLDVRFVATGGEEDGIILLENHDVTDAIRTETIGNAASVVASNGVVRAALLDRQRGFCQAPGLVADGRDMGTVVFPRAEVKVFITASAWVRAERRYKQLKEKGLDVNLAAVLADIEARDERDRNRPVAPLVPAADATIIDTSSMSVAQVVHDVLKIVASQVSQR
ncbi:MAG: (d)CMP kinase [Gammaproteobacteria bacterium]|nr:(d)CMP kinase [Gammaproteobacteria bacterium]